MSSGISHSAIAICNCRASFARNAFLSHICLFLILSGCAGVPAQREETVLLDRCNQFWQHRVKKEFAECYLMEAPEVRAAVSLTNYVIGLSGGMIWISASVRGVRVQGDSAVADLEIAYAMMGIYSPKGGITTAISDNWKRIDGKWWHVYRAVDGRPSR